MKRAIPLLFLLTSFLVPFLIYVLYCINSFYHYGAEVLDSGWFIFLSTNLTPLLQNPPVLFPTYLAQSYLNTHISPIFTLFSLFYKLLFFWIAPEIYFALLLGFFYALVSLATFIMVSHQGIRPFFSLVVSLLVAFNAQSLAMTGFPHFEIAIPSLMLLFFVLYLREQKKASLVVFLLLLATREDAGFHFFGLIVIFAVIEYVQTASLQKSKELMRFALIAFAYSLVALIIQKSFFTTDDAFTRIYAGKDFFAHLDADFFAKRVTFLFSQRDYLYAPVILLFFAAFLTKNYYLLVPFFSILPWTLLSICAITDMPATLSNYYAFPFIFLFVWIAPSFYLHSPPISSVVQKQMLATMLLVTLSSILLFKNAQGNVDGAPWHRVFLPDTKEMRYTHKFKKYLKHHKSQLGNILFDEAMSLFVIDTLQFKEYLYINTFSDNDFGRKQREEFTTLIFKEASSKHLMFALLKEKSLENIYRVKHTDIIIASAYNIEHADFLVPFH